jgi:hypothetical protein
MFDYGTTDVTVEARDRLADLVMRRYRDAVGWQSSEIVGGAPLRRVLQECYEQANAALPAEDREMAEDLGVTAYVGLTAMKGGVVQAFLTESLVTADGLPWRISPTPLPSLSEDSRLEALALARAELLGGPAPFAGDVLAFLREVKGKALARQKEASEAAARRMLALMHDQCAEGSFRQAMSTFLYNFVFYPFGAILGPIPTRGPRLAWRGGAAGVREDTYYSWEAVSPWDFWYSPDSRSAQEGTCVLVRKRVTRRQLLEMRGLKSYIGSQVDGVLEDSRKDGYNFRWLSANPDQPDGRITAWDDGTETVDMLVHYGMASGRELSEYGLGGLERGRFYDATVTVIGGYTVQVFVAPDPAVSARPVFTASFYRTRDRIANFGISQRMRGVERAFMAAFRYMIRNMASSSAPVWEADWGRVSKYLDDDSLDRIDPGQVFIVESDPMVQGPALRPQVIPGAPGQFARALEYFMDLADRVTNIPAALHGTAVGTGANRTFRGMAMLQSNAVKSIQDAVANIDEGVYGPMGQLLYGYNMLYHGDRSVKGDAQVMAQGVQGLLAQEEERNTAFEVLQLVGSVGAQLGGTVIPVLDWALRKALVSMRVPEGLAAQVSFSPPQQGLPAGAGGMPADAAAPPPEAGPAPGGGMPPAGPPPAM